MNEESKSNYSKILNDMAESENISFSWENERFWIKYKHFQEMHMILENTQKRIIEDFLIEKGYIIPAGKK